MPHCPEDNFPDPCFNYFWLIFQIKIMIVEFHFKNLHTQKSFRDKLPTLWENFSKNNYGDKKLAFGEFEKFTPLKMKLENACFLTTDEEKSYTTLVHK